MGDKQTSNTNKFFIPLVPECWNTTVLPLGSEWFYKHHTNEMKLCTVVNNPILYMDQ